MLWEFIISPRFGGSEEASKDDKCWVNNWSERHVGQRDQHKWRHEGLLFVYHLFVYQSFIFTECLCSALGIIISLISCHGSDNFSSVSATCSLPATLEISLQQGPALELLLCYLSVALLGSFRYTGKPLVLAWKCLQNFHLWVSGG